MRSFLRASFAVFAALTLVACLGGAGTPTPTALIPTAASLPATPAPVIPSASSTPAPTFTIAPAAGPAPALSGQVTDAVSGKGIAGAAVQAQSIDYQTDVTVTSATNGSYAFAALPAGDYRVWVTAQGYAREYYDNVSPSNEAALVHLTAGREAANINFHLTAGGAIRGTVYQHDGATPLSGAEVWVYPSKYPQDQGFQAVTAADGHYSVEGLSLGSYKVTARAAEYALFKYYPEAYGWWNAKDVLVTPPGSIDKIDLKLDPASSISGYVFQSDGVTPIANINIIADTEGREGVGTMSQADGSFRLDGLTPTSYVLRIQNPAGWASEFYDEKPDFEHADAIILSPGQQAGGVIFTLDIGAPIHGHIYDEESGQPISGAQIVASLEKSSGSLTNTTTLPDGSYELWVGAGCYHLGIGGHMMAPGYVPEYWDNRYSNDSADRVCIKPPQGAEGIDLRLARAGSISGTVYERDAVTPIAGASVYAFPVTGSHPGAGANTQPDGSYTIQGLPSGLYRVQVTASGHGSQYYRYVDGTDPALAAKVDVSAPGNTPGIDFALSLEQK